MPESAKGMVRFAFALTNVYADEQVLASAVLESYLRIAAVEVFPDDDTTILTLIRDTPWLLLRTYSIRPQGPTTLISPTDAVYENNPVFAFGQQYIILAIALSASVLAHSMKSSFIFVDNNGPVPSSGFASMLSLVASTGVPVVYWKDEERTVWGLSDDPLTVGCLPGATRALVVDGSPRFTLSGVLNKLNIPAQGSPAPCTGATMTFPILIREAIAQFPVAPSQPPPLFTGYLHSLVTIGQDLNDSVLSLEVNWQTAIKDNTSATYATIKRVLALHYDLLGDADKRFLGPVLGNPEQGGGEVR